MLAWYHEPMAGRYVDLTPLGDPAIVANRFGRGTAVYLAGTFGEMLADFALPEHRRLAVNLVDALSRRDVRLEAGASGGDPINVEMTVRVPAARPSRLVVHLVNHAGVAPRPFEAVSVQAGLRLRAAARLGVRSARALAAGKRLKVARDAKGDVHHAAAARGIRGGRAGDGRLTSDVRPVGLRSMARPTLDVLSRLPKRHVPTIIAPP